MSDMLQLVVELPNSSSSLKLLNQMSDMLFSLSLSNLTLTSAEMAQPFLPA
jgi:hypothetical protein